MTSHRKWTADSVRALGARTDLVTACSAVLGVGKTKAWEAFHAGELPFPVIRCGRRVVVPVAPLLELLRLTPDMSEGTPASVPSATDSPNGATTDGRVSRLRSAG